MQGSVASHPSRFQSEIVRLSRRATDQYRDGGIAGVLRTGSSKLAGYVAYQGQRGRQPEFVFDGDAYRYFAHPYNATWTNERSVEIPIARRFLSRRSGTGLEVGNVLAHYGDVHHAVIDKYERSDAVLRVDVVDYRPPEALDYIVAVSTLEHVGWDETPRDRDKAVRALAHLRSLLASDGRLLVTCPVGHNPGLDEYIFSGDDRPLRDGFLRRRSIHDRFTQAERSVAERAPVGDERCLVLWVAEFGRSADIS